MTQVVQSHNNKISICFQLFAIELHHSDSNKRSCQIKPSTVLSGRPNLSAMFGTNVTKLIIRSEYYFVPITQLIGDKLEDEQLNSLDGSGKQIRCDGGCDMIKRFGLSM